jgi:hypothetical protein
MGLTNCEGGRWCWHSSRAVFEGWWELGVGVHLLRAGNCTPSYVCECRILETKGIFLFYGEL